MYSFFQCISLLFRAFRFYYHSWINNSSPHRTLLLLNASKGLDGHPSVLFYKIAQNRWGLGSADPSWILKRIALQKKSLKRLLLFPLFLSATLLLQSCSHYQLGSPPTQASFHSLYVAPVVNESFVPQAQALLSAQIIQLIHESNVSTTACPQDADATLSITLCEHSRSIAASQEDDSFIGSAFTIFLKASITLTDNRTGQAYVQNYPVCASIYEITNPTLQAIEYQDMPILTRKLAQNICNIILNLW